MGSSAPAGGRKWIKAVSTLLPVFDLSEERKTLLPDGEEERPGQAVVGSDW